MVEHGIVGPCRGFESHRHPIIRNQREVHVRTYTVREAAGKLKLGRSTVTHLCKENRIKAHQEHPRGHYVISANALREFREDLKTNPMGKSRGNAKRKVRAATPVRVVETKTEVSDALVVVRKVRDKLSNQLDTLCKIETLLTELSQ